MQILRILPDEAWTLISIMAITRLFLARTWKLPMPLVRALQSTSTRQMINLSCAVMTMASQIKWHTFAKKTFLARSVPITNGIQMKVGWAALPQ